MTIIKTTVFAASVTALYIIPWMFCLILKEDGNTKELRAMGTFGTYSIPSCIAISTTLSATTNDNAYQFVNVIPAIGISGLLIADQINNY